MFDTKIMSVTLTVTRFVRAEVIESLVPRHRLTMTRIVAVVTAAVRAAIRLKICSNCRNSSETVFRFGGYEGIAAGRVRR